MTNIEKLYIRKLKEYIIKVDYLIGNYEMSNMILTRIRRQIASLEQQISEKEKTYGDKCIHCGKEINPSFDPCCSLDCWSKEFD